jgi:hypothetical protein
MKTFFLIFTMMVYSLQIFSQVEDEKKYIMIRKFKGQDQLGQSLSSSLNRTVIKYLASLPGYELLLNSSSPPEQTLIDIFAVEGIIERQDKTLSFTLDLLDIKKKVVVKTVKKTEIREEDFIRLIQGGLEALFLSLKNYNPNEKSERKTSKGTSEKEESSIVTNAANDSAIDFKQRIKGLQEGADSAITKKQDSSSTSEETNSEKNISSSSSGDSLFSTTDFDRNDKKEKTTTRVIRRDLNLEVFYEKRSIDTVSYIQTISQLNILHVQSNGNLWHNENKNLFFKYHAGFGKPLASELPAPSLINLGLLSAFTFKDHSFGIGVKKEDLLFFNISEPGGGLKSGTIQATWAQLMIELNPIIKDRKWNIRTQYLSSVSSSSGWKPLSKAKSFQGNSIGLDIGLPYTFYGLTPRLSYQSTKMVGEAQTSVKLNDTRIAMGATYYF